MTRIINDWLRARRWRAWLVALTAFLVAASLSAGALAWQSTQGTNPVLQARPPAPAKPAAQPTVPVSAEQILYLVRSTLLRLNDANRSGNYTVMRDLAAPDFQAKNTAADLGQSFADLRRRNFDLFAVALLEPKLTAGPDLDSAGRLRLAGFFATRPQQIRFDLTFQSVGGRWRLLAISVATPNAPPT